MDQRVTRLLDLLDTTDANTVGTSVRLPANLREAAALAAEMGLGATASEIGVRGLRDALEALAQRAVLDDHYQRHPEARPDLAEVALAAAQIDGNPLAESPDLIRRAARELAGIRDGATADDVLMYAAGLASAVA